ncbi:MAG TPA: hypothetical protein VGZ00_05735 [Candidatus Baltobacteraceae bacterium]|jgi:hypothetical protein|nr:hypothetical protein [Candidatus Baltobacteraceae bacterium]
MKSSTLRLSTLAVALAATLTMGVTSPARADTGSTAAIIAGAAAIVGALIYDSNNHPYYVRDGHRYYVTEQQAGYYRQHHHGNERRAYVPEQEYPVARSYNQFNQHGDNQHGDDHGH